MVTDRRAGPATLLALVAGAGTVTCATLTRDLATTLGPVPRVDDVVALALVATGTVTAGWYALTALGWAACSLARLGGRRWARAERALARHGAPLLRRALATGLGVTLSGAASWGVATADPVGVPDDLGWRPAAVAAGSAGHDDRADPQSAAAPGAEHVVRPGDTLWEIARDGLQAAGRSAEPADVALAWPRWYAVNADVVGPDPDLIRPGQVLVPPSMPTPPTTGGAR